jgi:hypothetical protein
MLLERGIVVSYETIRRWAIKFGADYARRLKRKAESDEDARARLGVIQPRPARSRRSAGPLFLRPWWANVCASISRAATT